MNPNPLENIATLLLGTAIVVLFCTEIILNLTPPISRDALIHHLAIPKLWLKHGGFYEIPWADYSYYPMYINLLYLVCLYFKNDIIPKFIHFAFGFATGWLIFFYLKEKFDRNWGLLGMVIFITTPIVIWLSTSVYVDLGMTFFTTASVLSFVKWRDSEYSQFKWILIASCCMGMAAGSKYNALITWVILNLILMFSYAKDTQKQTTTLKYGFTFFIIAALVASPWYLKNYIQTGNPFYPLFNSFFLSLHHQPVHEIIQNQATEKIGRLSFFKMREVMYGETFWETLLIPIRMFFQGEDNSYRYFQGVLNPILIVFSPFILLNKKYVRDKYLFTFYSILFITMAYFLTEKQVRYILPVLPFLSILAVMGIKELTDKLNEATFFSSLRFHENVKAIFRIVLFASISILLASNFFYLRDRIHIIKPFPFIFGKESREDFLKRHLLHYDSVRYINNQLFDDVIIFTMFLGRRGYYLDRTYRNERSFGTDTLNQMIKSSASEEKFKEFIKSMDVTHILMRTDLVDNYLQNNFTQEEIKRYMFLVKKYWKLNNEYRGYAVWEIKARQ